MKGICLVSGRNLSDFCFMDDEVMTSSDDEKSDEVMTNDDDDDGWILLDGFKTSWRFLTNPFEEYGCSQIGSIPQKIRVEN